MNNHQNAATGKSVTANPADPERRKVTKLIAALTLFGMGLGVNLEEAFAGLKKLAKPPVTQDKTLTSNPSVDYWKKGGKPSVTQDKTLTSKPSVDYWKKGAKPSVTIDKSSKPSINMHKLEIQQSAPARPGVTRVKPVPASTSELQSEIGAKGIIPAQK